MIANMKQFIFSVFCLTLFGSACAQSGVVDFTSAMMTAPIGKKVHVMNVVYKNGQFDGIQENLEKRKKPNKQAIEKLDLIGEAIDGSQLIDYRLDTVYVLSTHYLPASSESMTVKTRKGAFDFIHDPSGGFILRSVNDSYANMSADERASESMLHQIIFSWDIGLLMQIIKSNGGPSGSEYYMSATRIILKDNVVAKKDIVNFAPVMHWNIPNEL